VRTGRLSVGMGSTGLREVKGVEASEASPSDVKGRVWSWAPVAEVDKAAHRMVVFPWVPQPV
jgi:hypothetical protein